LKVGWSKLRQADEKRPWNTNVKASFFIDSGVFFLVRFVDAITRSAIGLPRCWVVAPAGDVVLPWRSKREIGNLHKL